MKGFFLFILRKNYKREELKEDEEF
jgi:hypothetical protein